MLSVPSPWSNVGEYTIQLSEFVKSPLTRQITGGIHVNDALIYNAWEALPAEWTSWWSQLPDARSAQQDLIEAIEESGNIREKADKPLEGRPESLSTWLALLRSLALARDQLPGRRLQLPQVLTSRMKTKKIDEVSVAAAYISSACESSDITHIIDMGSGQGYLSVSLAYLFPHLRILAIDGSGSQIAASRDFAASLDLPDERIRHMLRYIDGTQPLATEIVDWAGDEKCMLVGLHACGNLSEHMMRYFTDVPSIIRLGAIGCCYNHIIPASTDNPDGFPISAALRSLNVSLSATALMTGCQAPNNWEKPDLNSKGDSMYTKRRFYRALLEKVFFDKGISVEGENRPPWGVRKGDMVSFATFARRAMSCLEIGQDSVRDDELVDYEEHFRGHEGKIAILWTLSVLCCKVVESVIAVDRYLFLLENGAGHADVLPIFDYKTSPRNLMLVACKGSELSGHQRVSP